MLKQKKTPKFISYADFFLNQHQLKSIKKSLSNEWRQCKRWMVNDFRVRTNYKTNSICSPLMRPEVYNHRSPLLCCGWLVWGKAPPPMCGLDKIRHTPQLTSRSAGQIGQTIARILKKMKNPQSISLLEDFQNPKKAILQQFLGKFVEITKTASK